MTPDSPLVDALAPSPSYGDRRGRVIDSLILHYTGMRSGALALARLRDPASQVSCHYLVWEDGRIEQLVAERHRAWHAGRSFWAGETDMNAVSIGVEIVNPGHDGGCPAYPPAQVDAVVELCRDICARRAIVARRVLGHSDVAPDRKIDPGEWFPWARLAAAGIGLWVPPAPIVVGAPLHGADAIRGLQTTLRAIGYACPLSGTLDEATARVLAAFQRHYRPQRVDGIPDPSTVATLDTFFLRL